MFNISMNLGPFIVNFRQDSRQVELVLKELNFEIGEVWHYDLHGIISSRRKYINASAYEHESRTEL